LRSLSWPRSAAEEITQPIVKVPTVAQRVLMAASPTAARLATAERPVFTRPAVVDTRMPARPLGAVTVACLDPQMQGAWLARPARLQA